MPRGGAGGGGKGCSAIFIGVGLLSCLDCTPPPAISAPLRLAEACFQYRGAMLHAIRGGGPADLDAIPQKSGLGAEGKRHARAFPAALLPFSMACQRMGIPGVEEGELQALLDDWPADAVSCRVPDDFPVLSDAIEGTPPLSTVSVDWGEHWSGELVVGAPLRVQGGWAERLGAKSGGQPQLDGQLVINASCAAGSMKDEPLSAAGAADSAAGAAGEEAIPWPGGFAQLDVTVEATLAAGLAPMDFTAAVATVHVRGARWSFDACAVRSRHGVAVLADGAARLRLRLCALGGLEDVTRRSKLDAELRELLCSDVDAAASRAAHAAACLEMLLENAAQAGLRLRCAARAALRRCALENCCVRPDGARAALVAPAEQRAAREAGEAERAAEQVSSPLPRARSCPAPPRAHAPRQTRLRASCRVRQGCEPHGGPRGQELLRYFRWLQSDAPQPPPPPRPPKQRQRPAGLALLVEHAAVAPPPLY